MKMTKSYKIVLLLTAIVMFITSLVFSINFSESKADTIKITDASKYFTGLSYDKVRFADGNVEVSVKDDSTNNAGVLSIANKLAVNDLGMELIIPEGLEKLTIVLKNNAYFANGNIVAVKDGENYKKANGEYVYKAEKVVENQIEFDFSKKIATINGKSNANFSMNGNILVVKTVVTSDNFIQFTFGSQNAKLTANDIKDGNGKILEGKRVANIADNSIANVDFKFDVAGNDAIAFKIKSINQKASDTSDANPYKQTFETDEHGAILDTDVLPVITLADSFYKKNSDGTYSIIKNVLEKYTLTLGAYSVLGNVDSSDVYVKAGNGVWVETNDSPRGICFKKEGTASFDLVAKINDQEKTLKTVSGIQVVNFDDNTQKPVYVYDKDAYEAYQVALKCAYYDADKEQHVALGTSMELPSLKDLVFDDVNTYKELKKTVYYSNNTSKDITSSTMSFSLSEAGKYLFAVTFADTNGNAMDREKDFEKGSDYAKYVFEFNIVDDADIVIEAAPSQGPGYVGAKYTASKFKIDAVGCNTTYTLKYNQNVDATENSDGWIEIPKATSVTDKDYEKDGYDYDDIKSISYDGSLTFTPDKKGAYMITCSATSNATSRNDEASTIIRVAEKAQSVKVYNTEWLENNVWSVVFLSVGTLCLIAIIVLLCIKPKDQTESD